VRNQVIVLFSSFPDEEERTEGDMGRMLGRSPGLRASAIAALLMCPLALSQVGPTAQPESVIDVLHQLSDKADIIFAGQVVAVRHPNGAGWVEVEFRVDQAIRGCSVGTPYVLREWAGLWAGTSQRYRVGQRLLMLLHAPGAAGMSSPVSGLDGAIPIRQGGAAATPTDFAPPRQPPFVDLRWLGARLPRAVSYQSASGNQATAANLPGPFLAQERTTGLGSSGSITNFGSITPVLGNASPSDASVPAQQASVDAVVGMLITWQKAQHAAP
jgi:hypothetical protein